MLKTLQLEDRILRETGDMFFRHGIRSITMDDIASALGISKKTIYIYYKDKSDLVRSFTDLELSNHQAEIHDIRDRSKDPIDEIFQMMAHLESFFKKVNPSMIYDLQKYHPQSWQLFKDFKEKVVTGFVEENLRKGIQMDLYRKEIKLKILSRLRIEEVEMGFNPQLFPPDQYRMNEVHLALIEHFLYGIVTLKGLKLIEKYKKQLARK